METYVDFSKSEVGQTHSNKVQFHPRYALAEDTPWGFPTRRSFGSGTVKDLKLAFLVPERLAEEIGKQYSMADHHIHRM